ncbi:MAG TPA: ComEC/Rec2 family competence protein [Candidatus Peribacteria bacterium]|nr:ComEC/Rec2 family competence protein [Candidatus Peribacteria bacterium]
MKASRISFGMLLSFVATLFALRWWQSPAYPAALWILLAATGVAGAGLALLPHCRTTGLVVAAMALGTGLAVFSVARTTHVLTPASIENFANARMYTLHGFLAEAPDRRQMQTKIALRTDTLTTSTGAVHTVTGIALITNRAGWPDVTLGDEISAYGALKKPGVIEDFSYDDYLSLRDIYAVMPTANIRLLKPLSARNDASPTDRLFAAIFALRDRFELHINRMQPEPQASLLTGLLTGSRGGMPQDLLDAFRTAGLSHIVAISGYNITIIITLVSGMLFWLPLKRRFPLLVLGIALFTVFVGASASVVRAAVMGILGLFALQHNRQANIRLLVLWTAFFMLMLNPKQLWFDAGFQLSFLAVIGLAELSGPLGKRLQWLPETLGIRDSLIATMAAQIATLPLSMLVFRQLSLVAPFANILVAPLIPLAMLFGFIGTVLGFVWMPLGLVPSYVAWGILNLIIVITKACAAVPYAAVFW